MKISIKKYAEALTLSLISDTDSGAIKEKISNFLKLLQKRKKTKLLKRFLDVFRKVWYAKNGKMPIKVFFPKEPSEKELDSFKKNIEDVLGKDKKIILDVFVDPEILGGMKLIVEDSIIDGTVKKNLEILKSILVNS